MRTHSSVEEGGFSFEGVLEAETSPRRFPGKGSVSCREISAGGGAYSMLVGSDDSAIFFVELCLISPSNLLSSREPQISGPWAGVQLLDPYSRCPY